MIYIDGGLETIYNGDERWTDEFYLGMSTPSNVYILNFHHLPQTRLLSTWDQHL